MPPTRPSASAPPLIRKDALIALTALAAMAFGSSLCLAQAAPVVGPATAPTSAVPTTLPSPAPAPVTPAPAPAAPSIPEAPAANQPFVGTVTADKVYVRSGPGSAYYELGHLAKGDLIQVVDSRPGWYHIYPPNGAYCMIAKEFVEADAFGQSGTVKGDYINLRAGTALNKARDPSAVLCVVRKGTKLTILGSTDKYYEVAPTDRAYVWISSQFVKPAPGSDYKIPELKLPAGTTGPAKDTVTVVTTLPPTSDISQPPAHTGDTVVAPPGDAVPIPGMTAQTKPAPLPPPQPAPTYSPDAYNKFTELNNRYQAELQKPVGTRQLDGLIADYKSLGAQKDLPASVKQGTEVRIAALEKLATIQRLQKENAVSVDALDAQRKALHEEYGAAEKAIEDYQNSGPYLAQGKLQTSTAVAGKYALVNPATGRTVAYVDPASPIDIGKLLGEYIGVRGTTATAPGTEVTVIKVSNATLLPAPATAKEK